MYAIKMIILDRDGKPSTDKKLYWPKSGAGCVEPTDKNLLSFKTRAAAEKYLKAWEDAGEVQKGRNYVTSL